MLRAGPGYTGCGRVERRPNGRSPLRSGLTKRQFVTEYVNTLTPVIVTDGFDHWAARTRWSVSFFRERYGSRLVEVDGVPYSLSELIDRVERSTPAVPAPYLRNVLIED